MTREGGAGRFGQRCARSQHGLSGGANASSLLLALAAGQVEVSKRDSPSLLPCIPPSQLGRGGSGDGLYRAALLPLLHRAHCREGKPVSNPTSAPPWDQGEDIALLSRAQTFTITFGPAAEILPLSHWFAVGRKVKRGLSARAGGEAPWRVAQGE